MNAVFYVSAFLMLLLAVSFAGAPLLRRATVSSTGRANAPLLVVAAAMLIGIALYAAIGRPGMPSNMAVATMPTTMQAKSAVGNADRKAASVSTLLMGLEQRLQENPDDARGWLLLAKSYDHLGRLQDAAGAYDKAAALGLTDDALAARLK